MGGNRIRAFDWYQNQQKLFGHLILKKIMKMVVTKGQIVIVWLKCTKIYFGCGSAPDLAGRAGAYSAPTDLLAGFKGPTSKGDGRKGKGGEGEVREGRERKTAKGREYEENGWGLSGKGGQKGGKGKGERGKRRGNDRYGGEGGGRGSVEGKRGREWKGGEREAGQGMGKDGKDLKIKNPLSKCLCTGLYNDKVRK